MCGIAGSINVSKDVVKNFTTSLYHRGPDAQNYFYHDNVNLVHTRLAIQDVEAAHQPMSYKEYTLIFNGEIYNHLELRDTLKEFSFKTFSDTETLLYLLIKYHDKALNMLDGMFAFSLFNATTKELFLARDRAGKKPLYFYHDNQKFLFASELNSLKNATKLLINEQNIQEYFRLGFMYKQSTPYQNVTELLPAHFMTINTKTLKIKTEQYFNIESFYHDKSNMSFEESLDKCDTLLHTAVRSRLESSDLEVGTFLSGGIDSGLITAIASKYKKDLKTFTVAFDSPDTTIFDESSLAFDVAQKYNTEHTKININFNNLHNDLETILSSYGEPFSDSSAIPSYYVSQEAKKSLTVILNGDGADELFAGYRRYVPFSKINFFNLPQTIKSGAGFLENIFIRQNAQKESLHNLEQSLQHINNLKLNGLDSLMLADFGIILPGDLLPKIDIATMAHSLEGRSPFLSKELLEFAPTLPSTHKINGKTTKYILRELSKKYLPEHIINQPKRGFEIPLKHWVNHQLKDTIHDYLSGSSYSSEFIDKNWIQNLLDDTLSIAPEKRAKMLWNLISLEIWHKKVYLSSSQEVQK
jgi:asparagine synthase (glutamine-hydrolysing)